MIDSVEGEMTGLALWLAVNTLRVTLCHQVRKWRGTKAIKVERDQLMARNIERKSNENIHAKPDWR